MADTILAVQKLRKELKRVRHYITAMNDAKRRLIEWEQDVLRRIAESK
jgi:hypothetical protein